MDTITCPSCGDTITDTPTTLGTCPTATCIRIERFRRINDGKPDPFK